MRHACRQLPNGRHFFCLQQLHAGFFQAQIDFGQVAEHIEQGFLVVLPIGDFTHHHQHAHMQRFIRRRGCCGQLNQNRLPFLVPDCLFDVVNGDFTFQPTERALIRQHANACGSITIGQLAQRHATHFVAAPAQ